MFPNLPITQNNVLQFSNGIKNKCSQTFPQHCLQIFLQYLALLFQLFSNTKDYSDSEHYPKQSVQFSQQFIKQCVPFSSIAQTILFQYCSITHTCSIPSITKLQYEVCFSALQYTTIDISMMYSYSFLEL